MEDVPQRIGPYRVLERIGSGGMGEVLLAHDERLDRKVAIKRIRGDASNPERRERFLREARLAARLSHPAIVQVHDLFTEGGMDHLVLEYVEGVNLRALARQGPLAVPTVLDLARQIAGGLQAAHRQGIVHRDLKTENILVTPSGEAKITDFGIAKLLDGAMGKEETFTRTDAVVGTCRTMSPEQARGLPLDCRTDLFSFGVLLYETLTGRSPFEAENALATLDRIVRVQHVPVREHNHAVPEPLSLLVDRLLEKDPRLRPRNAGEVAKDLEELSTPDGERGATGVSTFMDLPRSGGALPWGEPPRAPARSDNALEALRRRPSSLLWGSLIVLAALLAGGYYAWRRAEEPLYVAVLEPETSQRGPVRDVDLLVASVRTALLRGLLGLENISPKSVEGFRGSPPEVARAFAVDEVIRLRLDCRPRFCRISLDRIEGRSGGVRWAESFEIPADNFFVSANAVISQAQRAYPEHRPRRGVPRLDVTSADLGTYLRLQQRFQERRRDDLQPLLTELGALRKKSPRFLDAYLLEASVARYLFHDSREPRDLQHAFELLSQARELAPGDPQTAMVKLDIAIAAGELDDAESALEELQELVPGDVVVPARKALLLAGRGDLPAAAGFMREAADRRPSWERLVTLARLEYKTGQVDAARQHLQRSLELYPGNLESLSLLAQIEMTVGSPERAAVLYREITRRSSSVSSLSNLGVTLLLLGKYEEAAHYIQQLVDQQPQNGLFLLNLADALWLQGRRSDAEPLYRRVVELIEADPAGASNPQFLTVKAQALAHLGQSVPAVSAAQEASQLAPRDSGVAYEASVVYAVLGERGSALVSIEKALKLGYEPRWFAFPWFDSLRGAPEFQRLFSEGSASG